MSRRKSIAERVRERAWVIHRRNGTCSCNCQGPTREEREQAAREVMGGFLDGQAKGGTG